MNKKTVDLIMFMGQSNMAGRGDAALAPSVKEDTAYEYKAVSQPDCLFHLQEPFGVMENEKNGVYEPGMKTGSLVSAFVNAFYQQTHMPIVGVSCAKGGSSVLEWLKGTAYYEDAVRRMKRAESWLLSNGYLIRYKLMVWCQGCTDGDNGMRQVKFRENTRSFLKAYMKDCEIKNCFLIQTGNHRDEPLRYVPMQQAQEELSEDEEDIILVSRQFKTFASMGLMKDEYHYLQEAYNLIGEEAGTQAGKYLKSGSSLPVNNFVPSSRVMHASKIYCPPKHVTRKNEQ